MDKHFVLTFHDIIDIGLLGGCLVILAILGASYVVIHLVEKIKARCSK